MIKECNQKAVDQASITYLFVLNRESQISCNVKMIRISNYAKGEPYQHSITPMRSQKHRGIKPSY